jgi:hypothetical protein
LLPKLKQSLRYITEINPEPILNKP